MNKHISIFFLVLALASMACLSTAMSAPSAPSTALPTQSGSVPSTATPAEDYAGAVFWPQTQTTQFDSFCATVTASRALHLRAEPSEKAAVLAYLGAGEQVRVIELGTWWKIEADGQTGYANARYLQEGCE